jgi:prepilin peptidase CpaA
MVNAGFVAGLPLFLGAAAMWDLRSRTIPNLLTGGMATAGLLLSLSGNGVVSVGPAVLAGAVALVFGVLLQLARLVGGGDVKLFAALAIWFGPRGSVDAALATAIAGGVLALFFLKRPAPVAEGATTEGASPLLSRLQLDEGRDFDRVPYGVAVAAGGLWVWWSHLGFTGVWS